MTFASAVEFLARSRRAQILEFLIEHRGRWFSINELARESKSPVATVWHAAHDLKSLGLAVERRAGNAAFMSFNERSPAARAFLRFRVPSAHVMTFEAFAKALRQRLPDVQVKLFGSVARGIEGPASDVDVQVVYGASTSSKAEVARACDELVNQVFDEFKIVVSPLLVRKEREIR